MPPIGKADRYIVYIEYDIKAKRIQHALRKIFLYKRADIDGLRDHLARFKYSFHLTIVMWVSFKSEVIAAIERFIPTKMTKTKYMYSLPWIDTSIKRLIRKRDKLYFRARKSSNPDVKSHYNGSEHMFRRSLGMHIGNIFPISSLLRRKTLIPTAPEKMRR